MKPTIEKISKIVSDYTGIPMETIRMKTRKRNVVYSRQLISLFARKFAGLSLREIGEYLNPKRPLHHTTVLSGLTRIKKRINKKEHPLCMDVSELDRKIKDSAIDINDGSVRYAVKEIITKLELMPDYKIQPCGSFSELAKQLTIKLNAPKIIPDYKNLPIDRVAMAKYSNKQHVA